MLEVLDLFPYRYVLLLPVLNAIGYFLKHRTVVPNECIPPLLFAVACCASISIRWLMSGYEGWYFWFDTVFLYGIVNSLKLTISAIGSYEAVRAIRFSSRRMEVQIVKRPFIRLLVAFITATLLFGLLALIFGASIFGVFAKMTDGWVFGIFFITAFCLYTRLATDPAKITPLYIVSLVSVAIANAMFCMAGMTADVRVCLIGCILAFVFWGAAAACVFIPFMQERKAARTKLKDFDPDTYRKAWASIRGRLIKLAPEKQKELLEGFLVFRLVGDSIYNDVDMDKPLFALKDADGTQKLTSVASAKDAGADDAAIEAAKAYVDALIG